MLNAFLVSFFAQAPLILGGLLVYWWNIPTKWVGWLGGYGGGALVGAIAFSLMPDADTLSPAVAAACLMIGAATFVGLDHLVEQKFGEKAGAMGIVLGSIIDGVPECIIFGIQIGNGTSHQHGFPDRRHGVKHSAIDRPVGRLEEKGRPHEKDGRHVAGGRPHLRRGRRTGLRLRDPCIRCDRRRRVCFCRRRPVGHADRFAHPLRGRTRRAGHGPLGGRRLRCIFSAVMMSESGRLATSANLRTPTGWRSPGCALLC